jgi:hypothetical protein
VRTFVYNASGTPIASAIAEGHHTDQVTIAALPGDISQNGRVDAIDLLRLRQRLFGTCPPAPLCPDCGGEAFYFDINRDGSINMSDLTTWRSIWFGTPPATRAWQGAQLAP